jgi:chemotaxis protein methyltransferase CheR
MMQLPDDFMGRFQEYIYGQSALRFSRARLPNLEIHLRLRLQARDINDCEEYFRLIRNDDEEFQALIEGITTKETRFFRLPHHFQALEKKIVPEIEEKLSSQPPEEFPGDAAGLNIWSAGCSTGEEPYSIAMSALNALKFPRACKLDILASDISDESLKTAQSAFYERKALDRIPPFYRTKYIFPVRDGFMISNGAREKVRFRKFNLKELGPATGGVYMKRPEGDTERIALSGSFDLIFCRNVLIYFGFDAQQRLIDGFYNCLKPGGYFFTGDAEPLNNYRHDFTVVEFEEGFLYRKPKNENEGQA